MRTLKKEVLIAVLSVIFLGMLSVLPVAGAKKAQKSSQEPKYFELYIIQGPKTFHLQHGDLTFKTALFLGSVKSGLYGIPSPPENRLDIRPIEIMVFDPDTAGATMRLSKLAHIETAPAHSFDLKAVKVGPGNFDKVYRVKYDDLLPINLWCIDRNIPLRLTPVAKKPGWYRAVPEQELEAGVYAINFGYADGPRMYTGDLVFYPFVLDWGPELNPAECTPER